MAKPFEINRERSDDGNHPDVPEVAGGVEYGAEDS